MSFSAPPNPSDMTRDELETAVETLQDDVETLEEQVRKMMTYLSMENIDHPDRADAGKIVIGGQPIGILVDNNTKRSKQNKERSERNKKAINAQTDGGVSTAWLSDTVRERLLPIHEMWIDVQSGNDHRISGETHRRAAILFGQMIRQASGEAVLGVDASYNSYSISSTDGKKILQEHDDIEKVYPVTVRRAFEAMQGLSKVEDCDCSSIEDCSHGLVEFKPGTTNTIAADKVEFNAVMKDVEDTIKGSIDTTDDDNIADPTASETDGMDRDNHVSIEDELDTLTNPANHR